MNDRKKILVGLLVFLAVVSLPFWYTAAGGKKGPAPEPEKPATEKQCVESKSYMKGFHMDLLNRWRDMAVRDNAHDYVSREYGTKHRINFARTCMGCHKSKVKFCDRCHDYSGVKPYCWDCHVEPSEPEVEQSNRSGSPGQTP